MSVWWREAKKEEKKYIKGMKVALLQPNRSVL
jgi:hypothetical protein